MVTGRRLAALRAARPHDRLRRRAAAAGSLARPLRARRLRRRSRPPTTGTSREAPSSADLVVLPERRAQLRPTRCSRRPRARHSASSDAGRAARAGGRLLATSPRRASGSRPRRSRVPRAPVLDRRHDPGTLELPRPSPGIEVFNAGLRARGRAGPLVGALGRAARGGPPLPGARDRRLATIRASTPTAPRRGCARRAHGGERCSRRCGAGALLRGTGPLMHEVEPGDGDVVVRCGAARAVR